MARRSNPACGAPEEARNLGQGKQGQGLPPKSRVQSSVGDMFQQLGVGGGGNASCVNLCTTTAHCTAADMVVSSLGGNKPLLHPWFK